MQTNQHNLAIQRLSTLLEQLSTQAKQLDTTNALHKSHWLIENNNLFSQHLFSTESDQFLPYVNEISKRLTAFSRLYKLSNNNINKTEFALSSLGTIEQQISALMNAMQSNQAMHQAAQVSFDARKKVRNNSAKKSAVIQQNDKYNKLAKAVLLSSHQLYQQLSEHHEFERRLMVMVAERELQRQKSNANNANKLSQEVLVLHQRLGRCRQAISAIERNIEIAEKNNLR